MHLCIIYITSFLYIYYYIYASFLYIYIYITIISMHLYTCIYVSLYMTSPGPPKFLIHGKSLLH